MPPHILLLLSDVVTKIILQKFTWNFVMSYRLVVDDIREIVIRRVCARGFFIIHAKRFEL